MFEYNTKFKAGDLVLLGPEEECLIVIKHISRINPGAKYPVEIAGYSCAEGRAVYLDNIILSEEADRILTDPAEKAFWLLKLESMSEDV